MPSDGGATQFAGEAEIISTNSRRSVRRRDIVPWVSILTLGIVFDRRPHSSHLSAAPKFGKKKQSGEGQRRGLPSGNPDYAKSVRRARAGRQRKSVSLAPHFVGCS